jgi:hypothetical protein
VMLNRRRLPIHWIVSVDRLGRTRPSLTDFSPLRELDGGDRPLPIVAPDRDSQPVHFVKPNVLHRTGLSVGEDHGLADQLSLGLLELAEDPGRKGFHSWHG